MNSLHTVIWKMPHQYLMLQTYFALLCFDLRIIAFPSVLPIFLVLLCFPTIPFAQASPPNPAQAKCSMETAPLY